MSDSKNNKKPDYYLYVNVSKTDKPITHRIGAAWKHSQGDGFSIKLFAHPIGGKAVAFVNVDKEDEEDKELPTE